MINFPVIKQQLRDAVVEVGELQPAQVIWKDEAKGGAWMLEPTVILQIRTLMWQGIEEERLTFENNASPQVVTLVNQRKFILSIRVESFDQDVSSARFAGNVLDKIATRMKRSSVRAQIDSFAIEGWTGAKSLGYVSGGRQVSAFVLDIICSTVDLDVDTMAAAGGWIGEVQVTGTVKVPPDQVVNLDVKSP